MIAGIFPFSGQFRPLLAVLLVSGCTAIQPILSKSTNISRIHFNNSEIFTSQSSYALYHIEPDLFKGEDSWLFLYATSLYTTDGKTTSTVASGFGYYPKGFKQLNSTHVYVADFGYHCIKLVDREEKTTKVVAGTLNTAGYVDGTSSRFSYPWGIEVDERNPRQLLISEFNSHAIRSLDINSRNVSTVLKSGLHVPRGMTWYNKSLLVCNIHYILQISWDNNGTPTSTILTGLPKSAGYQDGPFSRAKFSNPYELMQFQGGLILVSDFSNNRLRLLNMFDKRVSPVCYGSDRDCTSATTISTPTSAFKSGNALYVTSSSQIRKFTEYECFMANETVYVYPDQQKVEVPLDSDNSVYLPPGAYLFHKKIASTSCSFYVNVLVSPVVRTAVFRSTYDVTCASLDNPIGRAFLKSTLTHRKTELQTICEKKCKMSTRQDPWYSCKNNLLTVIWPTMAVYPVDVHQVPATYSSSILEKLKSCDVHKFEIGIPSHDPPMVRPNADSDGLTMQMVLISDCTDQSKTYNKQSDKCS